MKIYLIDSFDNEIVFVYIDKIKSDEFTKSDEYLHGTNICGAGSNGD
jgi:hypothetical protein